MTTEVCAFLAKAVSGSLIASTSSARSSMYFRAFELLASIVKRLVIITSTPPGRTLSSDLAKK